MTALHDPGPEWRRDDRESRCVCGHAEQPHIALWSPVDGLVYGECRDCACTQYERATR